MGQAHYTTLGPTFIMYVHPLFTLLKGITFHQWSININLPLLRPFYQHQCHHVAYPQNQLFIFVRWNLANLTCQHTSSHACWQQLDCLSTLSWPTYSQIACFTSIICFQKNWEIRKARRMHDYWGWIGYRNAWLLRQRWIGYRSKLKSFPITAR